MELYTTNSTQLNNTTSKLDPSDFRGLGACMDEYTFSCFLYINSCHFGRKTVNVAMCMVIMSWAILIISQAFHRDVEVLKRRKYYIIVSLCFATLFYFLFNITRTLPTFYFLEFYFFSCYQNFLVNYFGRKAAFGSEKIKFYIYALFVALMLLSSLMTFYLFVDYTENIQGYQLCRSGTFTIIRTIGICSQLIFFYIAYRLNKGLVQEISFQEDLTQFSKTQKFAQSRRQIKQLGCLVTVNVLGSVMQLIKHVTYLVTDNGCQLIHNSIANNIFKFIIELVSIFVPFLITLYIFGKCSTTAPEKVETLSNEVESQSQFFEGLTMSLQTFPMEEEKRQKTSNSSSDQKATRSPLNINFQSF